MSHSVNAIQSVENVVVALVPHSLFKDASSFFQKRAQRKGKVRLLVLEAACRMVLASSWQGEGSRDEGSG